MPTSVGMTGTRPPVRYCNAYGACARHDGVKEPVPASR